MAFTEFKSIAQVQAEYGIKYTEAQFIAAFDLQPSEQFRQEFEFNEENIDIFASEASRCENVIYPILREVYKHFAERYTLWSHKTMSYDSKLTGTPDYLVSTRSELGKTVLGLPLLIVVEAKQNNFIEGWGQCLAELVAAQKLNQQSPETEAQRGEQSVCGIVTDGELWQFGQLLGTVFTKEKIRISITDLDRLFSAIGFLFAECQG